MTALTIVAAAERRVIVIDAVEVVTTVAEEQDAERIVAALIASGLCGCVKRSSGVESTYFWQESWHTASEIEIRALSLPEHVLALAKVIVGAHAYETPEIIVRAVSLPYDPYAEWLVGVVTKRGAQLARRQASRGAREA